MKIKIGVGSWYIDGLDDVGGFRESGLWCGITTLEVGIGCVTSPGFFVRAEIKHEFLNF